MKKLILMFCSALLIFSSLFVACGDGQNEEENMGTFYSLQEAYDNNFLTKDNLSDIAYYHNNRKQPNEELNSDTAELIKKAYAKKFAIQNADIEAYYGSYGGCIALIINDADVDYPANDADVDYPAVEIPTKVEIDGIVFNYNYPEPQITVWKPSEDVNKTIEVRGEFYTLEAAYENDWLDEDDLKSIACYYNDFQEKENPYSGMYVSPTDALSKDVENELKQAYLNQIAEYPEGLLENVWIHFYYGTYNGNIVIKIFSYYFCMDPMEMEEYYIGNVVFKGNPNVETWVYHIGS